MYPKFSEDLNKETDNEVYFYTPAFDPLNNFSAHAISLWGIQFPTAEHAFQWKKFSQVRPDIAEKILASKSPQAAKNISDANKVNQPSDWHDKKVLIMEEILKAKVEQHADVQDVLKKTGSRRIIENSPVDSFWGIGPDQKGQSMVGNLWMKIRDSKI